MRSPRTPGNCPHCGQKWTAWRQFRIESAATSTEEIGDPVYPPAHCKLAEHGIGSDSHAARQLRTEDHDHFDLLIGMDKTNLRNMHRIIFAPRASLRSVAFRNGACGRSCGGDFDGKIHLLMEYAGYPEAEVADPWYTDDFEAPWRDVLAGCQGLLDALRSKES